MLQSSTDMLKNLTESLVENMELPGIFILVRKDGKDLFCHSAGYRDVNKKLPLERDSILHMYSMTKPITGFAAALLLERGIISLGDAVDKYIPAFGDIRVWNKETGNITKRSRPVYIKDLYCMTSGLSYPADDPSYPPGVASAALYRQVDEGLKGGPAVTTLEFAERTAKTGILAFEPGSAWLYGTSADIMGAIIEIATGVPFSEFLLKEVFEPLEMHDTAFYCPKEKLDRLAPSYRFGDWLFNPFVPRRALFTGEREWKELDFDHLGILRKGTEEPSFISGGAGLLSTIEDYSHFADMLLNRGTYKGKRLLSPRMCEFFTSGGLMSWQQESMWHTWDSMGGYDYNGFMRIGTGSAMGQQLQLKGEYGWDGWLGTYFANFPSINTTLLLGAQIQDAGALTYMQRIRNAVLSNLE